MAFGHLSSGRVARLALLALSILTIIFAYPLAPNDNAFAAQVTVAWDPDASPGVAGYKVYWGTASKNYSWMADTSTQTTYAVPSLSEGATYYFAATAYDAARTESGFSNEVTYTVPSACTYTISPASQSFGAGGGTASTNVATGAACNWTASNGSSWISVTSGVNGTGSGKVSYSVAANTGTATRIAGLTVAGQTLTVNQAGAQTYTITASADSNGAISPSGPVNVASGVSQTFSIAPANGYKVANVLVDGVSVGAVSSYTFANVTASHTISASFAALTYTLSVSTSGTGNGAVASSPTGTTFNAGTSVTLTATPGANSTFAGWSGACNGTITTCTLTMNSNLSVAAVFNAQPYTITASAGTNGSIAPSGNVTVSAGASQSFTITPASGYQVNDVQVDGISVGKVSSYTFSNVTAGHTINATFAATNYTLTVSKAGTGSGTVTNSPLGTSFPAGTVVALTAAPDANSTFASWSGGCSGTGTSSSVTMNGNVNVTATFNAKSSYTITASTGANGSISPSGSVSVNGGSSQSFTITPASGYKVAAVTVDGVSAGAVTSYTFSNVSASHTINATFAALNYTLTVSKAGTGSGTVANSPSGTNFPAGTSVNLTAAPDANSTFGGWSGGCTGTGTSSSVIMNSNVNVTATFNAKSSYTITASTGANGSISPSGSVSVNAGDSQTYTISPASGYAISSVTVDGASMGKMSSYTFSNVTANHTINASFTGTVTTYTLTVTKTGSGKGTVANSPSGTNFPARTAVTLTAIPSWGFAFSGWSGACSGTSRTCTITMNSNASVIASFRRMWGH